ncbi:hypothetical protein OF117_08495 [Geodermatophilus sp. YIM 151500]|uniref:hypothetical protein n=1 Tax=Geodermatophilus sp. YIM 151500 TaxID=2984531 RepID=UPI0021E458EE|nr:hypothetical protein [Geodermatophilus sp. YIM 151500]MCV2489405.1 hypothetical protein [Geodermatophilus sp. YIM 151500]
MSRRVPARALLRSEWTKLRTSRSIGTCLLAYLAVVAAGAWVSLSGTTAPADPARAVAAALVGFAPAQLVLVGLGALVVTGEYRAGTVLVSLTAVPRRIRWLVAKTVLVAFWTALLTAGAAAACVAAVPVLTAGAGGPPVGDPVVLRAAGVQVAAAVLVVVLGVGLGALLRRAVPAVVLGVALVVVLPTAAVLSGVAAVVDVAWLLPALRVGEEDLLTVATRGSLGLPAGGDALLAAATDWPTGLAVCGAWALAAWVAGAVVTERRDV